MAISTHTLDIYGADLYLGTSAKDWKKLRKRGLPVDENAPEAAGLSQFATFHPDDGGLTKPVVILWLDLAAHRTVGDLVDTIAHEAAHAAGQLLEHVGHTPRGTDEPMAYLVGWLARWMWDQAGAARSAALQD